MRWVTFAILCIVLTVAVACYLGQPRDVSIPLDAGEQRADDLSIDRIRRDLRQLTTTPSRVTGHPGAELAAEHIVEQLEELPAVELEIQEFEVAVPHTVEATLGSTGADGTTRVPLYPLWPNLARTCQTPVSGITGRMVDVGPGSDGDLLGKRISGSIVVMDWTSNTEWLSVPEFGGKAVVFRGSHAAAGNISRHKFLTMPANIPRYYVARDDLPNLDRVLDNQNAMATIHCRAEWRRATSRNILARVSAGDMSADPDDPDCRPVVFHAYYDSISVVPGLSPGAEQACGAATLLELGRYFAGHPAKRPVYLLFTGGHGQALSGMIHFIGRLRHGLKTDWRDGGEDSLLGRMGRPGLFVGLDLSTRSQQYGLFCLGSFRGQWEHLIRHKFSPLGAELAKYTAAFRSSDDGEAAGFAAFVDCINLTLGRGWWTYFPYMAAFESEIPTLAGFPGVTLATLNDSRRYVDTPDDTFERLRFDLFEKQTTTQPGARAGIVAVAEALTLWSGPFVSSPLDDAWASLSGRVVWLDQERNYTPSEPLEGAMVFCKTGRGDKYLLGTRGMPAVMADSRGRFAIDGLIQITNNAQFENCLLEAYGTATETFLEANPGAMGLYREVLLQRGKGDAPIEPDGAIIYAVDMARDEEYPWKRSIRRAEQHLNLVCFPCRAFSLMGLTDPRGYIPLKQLTILNASTKSPPFQFGHSETDLPWGDERESLVTLWADPTIRILLNLGLGFQEKRLILINNGPELPEGEGFVLEELGTIPSMILQGSRDMWNLDESRIRKLDRHGVRNARIEQLHSDAKEHIERAATALDQFDYRTYRIESEKGWALEGKAYNEVLAMINNMIHAVLFYLALLLPLAYCLERLLIASETLKKRLFWIGFIFVISFTILAVVHPAFRFTVTPLLVLLAFVILALVVTVSIIIVGRMDSVLRERKEAAVGRHETQTHGGSVAVRAVDLGISNIRRRPQRGFLTGMTVVTVTFVLLSFTSLVPTISISKLKHTEGKAAYTGLLIRNRAWHPLPNPLYDSLQRNFGSRSGAVIAARAWFFSDWSGRLSQIDLEPVAPRGDSESGSPEGALAASGGRFTAVSLVCMEPTEVEVTNVDKALLAGRWFENKDEVGVVLPLHAAKQLGYGLEDIGRFVRVFGQELPVIGIIDGKVFDAIEDIDGEILTPVDFVLQEQQMALRIAGGEDEVADTLEEYIHHPSERIAILPFKFGRRLGATIRSIAVKPGPEADLADEAEGYAKRSNLTILVCDGNDVTLFAALNTNQISAAWQIVIPVFLGFVIILSTMLGSVYERRGEIFVYSSVGLNPTNVSSLFLAESSVYAIIGAGVGYLLGQVVSQIMQATGWLSGLSLNYSAGSAVLVAVVTMAIVVISSIYPARKAYEAAVPDSEEEAEALQDEASAETIRMYLPFVTARDSAGAMQAYMWEYLDSAQGVTVGQLAVDDLQAKVEMENGMPVPVLTFRAWLAPFDLGISHDAQLRVIYRADRDICQYHLTARHLSGDHQNWRRLTPRFILTIRKQLLMWRILSREEIEKYRRQGEALFRETTQSASANT